MEGMLQMCHLFSSHITPLSFDRTAWTTCTRALKR